MGPWNFVKGRLYEALKDEYTIKRVSRFESGSPAVGSHAVHVQEQEEIVDKAITLSCRPSPSALGPTTWLSTSHREIRTKARQVGRFRPVAGALVVHLTEPSSNLSSAGSRRTTEPQGSRLSTP